MAQAIDWTEVRAELCARIDALDPRLTIPRRRAPAPDLAPQVDAIRLLAHRAGMAPAVTVTHFIGSALARGERGALVGGWLDLLREAVGSERQDLDAAHSFAAACSVRIAG